MGSDDDNQSPCPHVATDMTMSYNCELFVNVVMGESKNSVAYRTIKDLIDNVKRRKLEKYLYKNPEEREKEIPKNLNLDEVSKAMKSTRSSETSSSSSDCTKVVKKPLAFLLSWVFYSPK